jgi:hypothetical protein
MTTCTFDQCVADGLVAWWQPPGCGIGEGLGQNPPNLACSDGTTLGHRNGEIAVELLAGDYVCAPDSATLSAAAGFTVATWIRPDAPIASIGAHIVDKDSFAYGGTFDGREWLLIVNSDYTLRSHVWTSSGLNLMNGTHPIAASGWSHIAMTWDGATLTSYVDGAVDSMIQATGTISASSYPVCYGGGPDSVDTSGYNSFQGAMDNVMVWNRALSATEMSALYATQQ